MNFSTVPLWFTMISLALTALPTVAESGFPGFRVVTWNGLLAPAKTPRAIVERLAQQVIRLAREPGFVARLDQIGVDAIGSTTAEFGEAIRADTRLYGDLVRSSGIRRE